MALLILIASFIAVYLVFNVAAGLFLTFYYYIKEKSITNTKEFVHLFLFPATGLGRWLYNRRERTGLHTEYDSRWFRYKNMLRINRVFMACLGGYGVYMLSQVCRLFHQYNEVKTDASEIAGKGISDIAFGSFGWMFHYSMLLALIGTVIMLVIGFLICWFIFVQLPKIQLHAIEKYQNKIAP
ncbi:MAG: hypothetical protein IPM95_03150 [Sphingobacteriales bacterium]|nr:hypothetical protein [Sphingobacteriales bacterium]